eukprot:1033967-Heterocapsa_arctica.AAC.1
MPSSLRLPSGSEPAQTRQKRILKAAIRPIFQGESSNLCCSGGADLGHARQQRTSGTSASPYSDPG